jgi:hypothetical protein
MEYAVASSVRFTEARSMEWVLQAAAAAALQWVVETIMTARHDRWRLQHKIPPTATQVRHFNSWLFALAVATLLYVQAVLVVFIMAVEHRGSVSSDVVYLAVFGGLTAYLWTAAHRRWQMLSP